LIAFRVVYQFQEKIILLKDIIKFLEQPITAEEKNIIFRQRAC
jgi:hypothetical protein